MIPVDRSGSVSEISPHHYFHCQNFDVFSMRKRRSNRDISNRDIGNRAGILSHMSTPARLQGLIFFNFDCFASLLTKLNAASDSVLTHWQNFFKRWSAICSLQLSHTAFFFLPERGMITSFTKKATSCGMQRVER